MSTLRARLIQSPVFAIFIIATLMVTVGAGITLANQRDTVLVYGGHARAFSAQELRGMTDVVVLAKFTGQTTTAWNSSDGKAWSGSGRDQYPMIYRDDTFTILSVLRGPALPESIVVRGVGGTAAGVTLLFEDQPIWKVGQTVLLLLAKKETPLQEGTQEAWTVVAHRQGAFRADGAEWISDFGLRVREQEIAD